MFDNVDRYGQASAVDPQLALRASPELVARVDRLAESLTRSASGAKVTHSSAARVALERGLAALEAELTPPPPASSASASTSTKEPNNG